VAQADVFVGAVANTSAPRVSPASGHLRGLSPRTGEWFAKHTLRSDSDNKDPRIDLVNANLKGLPGVTLINAQIDPLRSDADLLETALKKAGVKVEHKVYAGTTHEFFGMAAVVPEAKQAQELAGNRLQSAWK
jgi:acetyl esterase/lipase